MAAATSGWLTSKVVDGRINFLKLTAFVNDPAFWGLEFRYDFQ